METETSDTFWRSYITEAMSFAVLPLTDPRAKDEAMFGLLEEVGEVAGVFKRQARGDNDGELDRDKLAKELGDLLWYTVRIEHLSSGAEHVVMKMQAACSMVHHEVQEDGPSDLRYLWWRMQSFLAGHSLSRFDIVQHIAAFAGLDLREVATKNLEKLRARKQVGTILGSGDDR